MITQIVKFCELVPSEFGLILRGYFYCGKSKKVIYEQFLISKDIIDYRTYFQELINKKYNKEEQQ